MKFDPVALECFIAISETGSFTAAADRVCRSQSAVSQQIGKLESMLGKPLFVRGRNFALTTEGKILEEYAKKILKLNSEIADLILQPDLTGEVKFGLPEDFAAVYLGEILTRYTDEHPFVSMQVECDLTMNLFNKFKKNSLDLVLVKMAKPNEYSDSVEVWSQHLEWVGDGSYFKKNVNEVVPLVLSPEPCVYRKRAIEALESRGIKWQIVFSSHSYSVMNAAVKAGMGITVMPKNMIPEGLDIIKSSKRIPDLDDVHISLLKHSNSNNLVNSLEAFIIDKLRH